MNTPKPTYQADVALLKSHLPKELLDLRRWMGFVYSAKDNRWVKPPVSAVNLNSMTANLPENWGSFGDVEQLCDNGHSRGFTFVCLDTKYVIIDVDDCVVDGILTEKAMKYVKYFDSYTEFSQSKTGIHIVIEVDNRCGSRVFNRLGVEVKSSWCILTGDCLSNSHVVRNCTDKLEKALKSWSFRDNETPIVKPEFTLDYNDQTVIDKMRRCKNQNAYNLFLGNVKEDKKEKSHGNDGLDYALALHLRYWTNSNQQQMARLMWNSGLVRDKWSAYPKYITDTIKHAVEERMVNGK